MPKSKPGRVVRAKSWSELPEILEPGTYYVDGSKFVIHEPVEKEFWMMAVKGVKRLAKRYYG